MNALKPSSRRFMREPVNVGDLLVRALDELVASGKVRILDDGQEAAPDDDAHSSR
jgi:hypothetical protein